MMVILRRNHVAALMFTCCFLVASVGVYNFALHPNLEEWRRQGLVVSSVNTSQKVVAITIDDGPNPEATPQVLKVLQQNQARATFFVLGLYAERHPALIKDIQTHGHEIGNHGFSHNIKQYNDPKFARSDVQRGQEIITLLTGVQPHLLRPPGGFLSRDLVKYCQDEKLTIITWTWKADYKDWKATNSSSLAQQIVAGVEPGQIILLHDGGENRQVIIDALSRALPELSGLGYRCITVSELLALRNQ